MEGMIKLDEILHWQHIVFVVAIQGILEVIKLTLSKLKIRASRPVEVLLPWSPIAMGALAGWLIPGALLVKSVGARIMLGVALGAVSGQIWKAFKTKLELLQGKK